MLSKHILKNIKLIVSDADGTLLDDKGNLGKETLKLVKQLCDKGVIFSLATGRLHSATKNVADQLMLNGTIISLDGALIKTYPDEKTIFESFIKEKYVNKALNYADELLLNVVLCHSDAIYFTENNNVIPTILDKYGALYKPVNSYSDYISKTLEMVFASDMKDAVKFVNDRMNFPYSLGCSTSFFRSHTYENIYYLEVRKSGSNKGKSFKRLLRHLNIRTREAAVLGDWYNDISMFNSDAVRVAVANAIPELKRAANHVTRRTNNEEGVAEFFEMVLKAKRD